MLNQRGKPRMQIVMRNVNSLRSLPKFALHPLIHTLLEFSLIQDMVANCSQDMTIRWAL
jgi:hypothetical protein